jgi:hypothetical protein
MRIDCQVAIHAPRDANPSVRCIAGRARPRARRSFEPRSSRLWCSRRADTAARTARLVACRTIKIRRRELRVENVPQHWRAHVQE